MDCKVSTFGLPFAILLPSVQAQPLVPAPAPAPYDDEASWKHPTSENQYRVPFKIEGTTGTAIDQGIACGLMLLASVLTYLIHTFDAPLNI